MSVEIRPIQTDDEAEQHAFISHYAFNRQRHDEESLARRAQFYPRDWCLGAFDGADLVAGLVVMPFDMYINGASIPLGGIASVSCLPERRRGGFVKSLLIESLRLMRESGRPLSALYTPHYSLYRRYGWEMANRMIAYSFPPKVAKPRYAAPHGSWRRVKPDDWAQLDDMYRQHYASRNGAFARTEQRWRLHVFSDYAKDARDAAVWSDEAGAPRAYVVYHIVSRPSATTPWPETVLRVVDWVALDSAAYTAMLNYLLGHDLVSQIIMLASADEPFAEAFEEPVHIKEPPGAWFGAMLRLVDLPVAIEARPALSQASGKSVTIAVTDQSGPWNAGTWHIECNEDRLAVERTTTGPDIELDVCALAPIYNGFVKPADAARVGSLRTSKPEALEALADLFAVSSSPYLPDDF